MCVWNKNAVTFVLGCIGISIPDFCKITNNLILLFIKKFVNGAIEKRTWYLFFRKNYMYVQRSILKEYILFLFQLNWQLE